MKSLSLDGHLGRTVAVELCHPCQAFWFDKYESLQLSPSSVEELFRIVKEAGQASAVQARLAGDLKCPRCERRLRVVSDMQRSTRFEYRACRDDHGRLITFFNFLREKNFIRPLSPAEIEELRAKVRTVNCSNCGAPVDLAHGGDCTHCGSPLSMIDVKDA